MAASVIVGRRAGGTSVRTGGCSNSFTHSASGAAGAVKWIVTK